MIAIISVWSAIEFEIKWIGEYECTLIPQTATGNYLIVFDLLEAKEFIAKRKRFHLVWLSPMIDYSHLGCKKVLIVIQKFHLLWMFRWRPPSFSTLDLVLRKMVVSIETSRVSEIFGSVYKPSYNWVITDRDEPIQPYSHLANGEVMTSTM